MLLFHSLALFLASLTFCFCSGPRIDWDAISARTNDGRAQLHGVDSEDRIPNEYIVMFSANHTHAAHDQAIERKASDFPSFRKFSFGYRAKLNEDELHELVRRDPGVRWVEFDQHAHLDEPVEEYTSEPLNRSVSENHLSQREYGHSQEPYAPYGLQMLSAGGKIFAVPVENNGPYDFVGGAGLGVNVYIFDTGIYTDHKFFEGRATNFKGLASTDGSPYVDESMADTHGHGTHVAGTVGAKQYGVAPNANLINVKVLGEGSRSSNIAQAILDVAEEHTANKNAAVGDDYWKFRGSVINMSLKSGSSVYSFLYQVEDANKAGVVVFASAGNKDKEASTQVPCAVPDVECIGAVDANYKNAWFSNYGSSVDYIAPGDKIVSLGIGWDEATAVKSGTSMACPHAAGAAAIFVSWQGLVNNQAASYVYSNSRAYSSMEFPGGTTNLFINTGIHAPEKYPKERFRWAGDNPIKNHDIGIQNDTDTDPVSALAPISTLADVTSTLASNPMSIPPGDVPLVDPSAPVGSATSYPPTLHTSTEYHFSFDPLPSSASAAPS